MTDIAASVAMGTTPYAFPGNGDAAIQRYAPTCRTLTPSGAMRRVWDLVDKIAPTNSAVLIRGEPGVGKETIAREIHRRSGRANRALVRMACGAVCEDQLDTQLFGRDGFRSAAGEPLPHSGLLGRSDRGTLFLKGISELPTWAQVKLLDCLQQSEYQQPATVAPTRAPTEGWSRCPTVPDGPAPLDVRVVATTTCDLDAAVAEGRFHSGLYYYVNIVEIRVPPLRERPEDIRTLAECFLLRLGQAQGPRADGLPRRFSEEAWQRLLQYDWPGNARELARVVAHAVMLSDRPEIGAASVAVSLSKARCQRDCEAISVPLAGGLKAIERSVIGAVIERCGGNKAKAARVLGLHRRTLYRLLQERARSHGTRDAEAAAPIASPACFPSEAASATIA
jgi:DNA-binding NtrC family response regulator